MRNVGHSASDGRMGRAIAASLFLFAACVYLLTAAGHIVSEDGTQMFNTTRSLAREGGLSIPWGEAMEGRNGNLYCRYGIVPSLVAVPFYGVGWALSAVGPALARGNPEFVERFAVSMVNPFIGALSVVIVFALGQAVGFTKRTSVALALTYGFATFAWAGSKYFVSEPLQGLFMAGAMLALIRRGGMGPRSLAVSGLLLGLGFLTKPATVVLYPAYAAIVVWGSGGPRPVSRAFMRLVLFSLPFVAAGLLSASYNYYRFGDPFEFGFGFQDPRNRAFSTPLSVGLHGLLLSSGKSLFLYAPAAALSLISFRSFGRRSPLAGVLCALVPLILVLFYARWVAWHGDGFWGPRYIMPALPFLILPVGVLLDAPRRRIGWRRGLFVFAVAAGLLVQTGGVTVSYASYFRQVGAYPYTKPFYDPDFMRDVHFDPAHSPILGHWKMLARVLSGKDGWNKIFLNDPVLESRVPVGEESADAFRGGLDIWYVHFYRAGVPLGLFVWIPILLAGGALVFNMRLRSLLRREEGAARAD